MPNARPRAVWAFLLFLLIIFPRPAIAATIAPTVYEQDDLGDPVLLKDFTYSLSVDCAAAVINVIVMDGHNKPVESAYTYLKYIDFSTPLISKGPTDREGFVLHKLPGSTTLMRGLFILVIEKAGFRSKEIHFDISGCYGPPRQPKPPAAKPPSGNSASGNNSTRINSSNGSGPQENTTSQSQSNATDSTNASANRTGRNGTGIMAEMAGMAGKMCLPAFAIAFLVPLAYLSAVFNSFFKSGKQ
jgi:hypothetical protein